MLGNTGREWGKLASFGPIGPIFFNDLRGKNLAPKAEVTGSNPVGCANDFKWLHVGFEGSGQGYFRIILVVAVPFGYSAYNRTCFAKVQLGFCGNRG
jgi:hypothetical protein